MTMKTPKKLTMWGYTPDGDRRVLAVFKLVNGKVEPDYREPNAQSLKEEMDTYGLYDKENSKNVFVKDGERFMQLLATAYDHATYVKVEAD